MEGCYSPYQWERRVLQLQADSLSGREHVDHMARPDLVGAERARGQDRDGGSSGPARKRKEKWMWLIVDLVHEDEYGEAGIRGPRALFNNNRKFKAQYLTCEPTSDRISHTYIIFIQEISYTCTPNLAMPLNYYKQTKLYPTEMYDWEKLMCIQKVKQKK